jgi:hypothetical protein
MAGLADKPRLTVDMETGELTLDLPEQMPDEALALPAPAGDTAADDTADTPGADPDKPAA